MLGLLSFLNDVSHVSQSSGKSFSDSAYDFGAGISNNINSFWDRFKNGRTNEVNKEIADQNLQFQRENLDYQKQLQREIFEREDTAYQRTVNDMRMAGLNPLSMQGTNGAGEAIATEPLENTRQFSDTSNMQAISGLFDMFNQLKTANSNATLNQANANLINEQAKAQAITNKYQEDLVAEELSGKKLSNMGQRFKNQIDNIQWFNTLDDFRFNKQFGISNNMPDWLKAVNIATHQGKTDFNDRFSSLFNIGSDESYNYLDSPGSDFQTLQDMINKNNDVKGAISESKIISGLLSMLGIKL